MPEDNLKPKGKFFKEILRPALIILIIIIAGSLTGYFLANKSTSQGKSVTSKQTGGKAPKEAGTKDEKKFPDKADGRIEVNDNAEIPEGSHRLIRPGGPSQIAYLTSSVVDLSQFINSCVQVWGETFSAQKAGWLMDVGYVKKLDNCPEGI